jgi:hypothetical protein
VAARPDSGTGLIGSVAGLLATVLFVAFSAQVLLGLYATSLLRATVHDAASRAANEGAATPASLDRLAGEAEASLGAMGRRTTITLATVDTDGDGGPDVVVADAVAVPPRIVPAWLGGMVGFEEIHAGARVRVERVR